MYFPYLLHDTQGRSSFTARTINPIKNKYKVQGLHSLDVRIHMCAINFPVSLHSEP
jgi:hypothetical protein